MIDDAAAAGRQFIGEPILPLVASMDSAPMAAGEPAVPGAFRWREKTLAAAEVLAVWREISDGQRGGEPGYVRKHWFRLRLTTGEVAELYFLRQPQGRGKPRWYLYTLTPPE